MTRSPELDDNSRLLVLVPHPDDETLATGGLIQMALAAGAKLRVIIATDGDNNPWPQRWIEKRWRIDASARARWGARRRGEASLALARLGVAEQDVRFFGWPDQGLTALLMADSKGSEQLAAEILEFAPSVIAAPSPDDLHPDHNALGTMLEIALSSGPFARCQRLDFVVHGDRPEVKAISVPANNIHADRKLAALQAHTSQLALSSRRMTRLCKRQELFESIEPGAAGVAGRGQLAWHWSIGPVRRRMHRHAVLLIIRSGAEVRRLALPLMRTVSALELEISFLDSAPLVAKLKLSSDGVLLQLLGKRSVDQACAKLERLGHRVLIYDRQGWSARLAGTRQDSPAFP